MPGSRVRTIGDVSVHESTSESAHEPGNGCTPSRECEIDECSWNGLQERQVECARKLECAGRVHSEKSKYYNEKRPHSAIGQKAPITLLRSDGIPSPPS